MPDSADTTNPIHDKRPGTDATASPARFRLDLLDDFANARDLFRALTLAIEGSDYNTGPLVTLAGVIEARLDALASDLENALQPDAAS